MTVQKPMASALSRLRRQAVVKPPITLLMGVPGVGKTTFASRAPNPVFLCAEDGMGLIQAPSLDLSKAPEGEASKSFDLVMQALEELYVDGDEFSTVIVDSLTALEPMIWAKVCADNGWATIETPGFGKGYVAVDLQWRRYHEGIRALRDDKNKIIVQIAHSKVVRFENPETDAGYDRYEIKLHKSAAAACMEMSDNVFFCNYRVNTVSKDAGFGKKLTRGTGRGQRLFYTQEMPAFLAKNRYGLPRSLDMDIGFDGLLDIIAGKIPMPEDAEHSAESGNPNQS